MLGLFLLACVPFPDSNAINVGADEPVFDPRTLPILRVTVPAEDWKDALADTIPDDDCDERPEIAVTVTYDNPATGTTETYEEVGMRYRGHSALWVPEGTDENRWGYKLSFNTFRSGRRFHGMKSINLLGTEGDKSLLRERLALTLMAEAGVPAPRANHGRLFVNGTYLGLFPLVEEADDEAFLENHFDEAQDQPGGSFYKVGGYCGSANLDYEGTNVASYSGYEARVDTVDADKAEDLIPMLACVRAGATDAQVESCLDPYVDLDAWRTELAVDALLFNVDGFGATGQNFLLYRPVATGKFVVIPYDLDLSWYRGPVLSDDIFDVRPPWEPSRPVLPDRVRTSDPSAYCARVLEVADAFDPDVLVPRIEELRSFLGPDIVSDPFVGFEAWGDNVDDVIEEVEARHAAAVSDARACDPPAESTLP